MAAPLPHRGEDGFTLIEMVVAVGLAAFMFAGLAAVMASGLRTVSIQRGRTQANEVATEAIEDLQRFPFNSLGLCSVPPAPPSGGSVPPAINTTSTVVLDCNNATQEQPCTPTTFSPGLAVYPVPENRYLCNRYGNAYTITRYVSWADPSDTVKQLAVTVDWYDTVGHHEVSEQSSLRAPDAAAIIGTAPPSFSKAYPPLVSANQVWVNSSGYLVDSNGLPTSLALTATTSGLSSTDQVVASYYTTANGGSTAQTSLTSSDGVNWSGTIAGFGQPGAKTFPTAGGSEYIMFSLTRAADGRANSVVATPAITLCNNPGGGGGCSVNSTIPSVSGSGSPGVVQLNPDGSMYQGTSLTITAATNNVFVDATGSDTVTAILQTVSGATAIALQPAASCLPLQSSPTECKSWTVTINSGNGYLFPVGNQFIYFTAQQYLESNPSTAAAQSNSQVSFT